MGGNGLTYRREEEREEKEEEEEVEAEEVEKDGGRGGGGGRAVGGAARTINPSKETFRVRLFIFFFVDFFPFIFLDFPQQIPSALFPVAAGRLNKRARTFVGSSVPQPVGQRVCPTDIVRPSAREEKSKIVRSIAVESSDIERESVGPHIGRNASSNRFCRK